MSTEFSHFRENLSHALLTLHSLRKQPSKYYGAAKDLYFVEVVAVVISVYAYIEIVINTQT